MARLVAVSLFLALGACGGPAPDAPATDDGPTPEVVWLARDLRDEDRGVRIRAAEVLATLGADAAPAVPGLLSLLREADPAPREAAERALAAAGEAAIPPLLDALAAEDWRDRAPAVKALAARGDAALAAVLPLLDDPARRAGALEVLAAAGAPDELDGAVLASLVGSESRDVRLAAARLAAALAATRIADALPALRAALRSGEEDLVVLASEAIGAAGPPAAPAVPDLIGAIRVGRYRVTNALRAVMREGDPASLGALANAIRADPESASGALDILAELTPRPVEHLPLFLECLGAESESVRRAAVEALSRCGDAAAPAVPALRRCLSDAVANLPGALAGQLVVPTARLLHRLGGEIPASAFPALVGRDPRGPYLGDLAARAGAETAVPAIAAALGDAGKGRADERALLELLAGFGAGAAPAAEALVDLLARDGADPALVAAVLSVTGVDAAPLLRAALEGASDVGRLNLLAALSGSGEPTEGFEDAVTAALDSGDRRLSSRACDLALSLAERDPAAPPARRLLARMLATGRDDGRAFSLVERAGGDLEPALRGELLRTRGGGRLRLLYALRRIGCSRGELEPALAAAFDEGGEIAREAAEVAGFLAGAEPENPSVPGLLVRAFGAGAFWAAAELADLAERGVDPKPLLRAALEGANAPARLSILYALSGLGEDAAPLRAEIVAALGSEDAPLRERALLLVGGLDSLPPEAAPLLLALLDDPEEDDEQALGALLLTGKAALPALEAWLEAHAGHKYRSLIATIAAELHR